MAEPIFESVKLNERKNVAESSLKIECRTDVLTEDVKILSVNAVTSSCNAESLDGQIKYSGKVIFYIIYKDSETISSCECGSEFSESIPCEGAKQGNRVDLSIRCEKTEFDLTGTKVGVSAFLSVQCEYIQETPVKFLSDGELIIDRKEIPFVKCHGRKKGLYPIEEEFELNYSVAKVLSQCAKAEITAVQCGVGCIIVDGEVYFSALLLQNIEKSDIIREDKILPFRMEMEYEEAMPTMTAIVSVNEKNFKTDVTVDGDSNKSTVDVSVSLCFEGEAFSEEKLTIASDAFSLTTETELEKVTKTFHGAKELKTVRSRILGRATCDELVAGARLMSVGGEDIYVTSVSVVDGKISVSGVLSVTGYIKTPDDVLAVRWQTPFENLLDFPINGETDFKLKVCAEKPFARIISLTEAEIEADGIFSVVTCEMLKADFVGDIKFGEEKKAETSAISVFIPEEGEELWSLAKRLNVCPTDLVATNKELQFPLTGKERIIIYRQK